MRLRRQCPFGAIRAGPGNAGAWIAIGGGEERHIPFEGGAPVAAAGPGAFGHARAGDLFTIRIGGARHEIPGAVLNGG